MPFHKIKQAYLPKELQTNGYVSDVFKKYSNVCFCLDNEYKQICFPGYRCGNCIPAEKCKRCDPTTSC